MGSVTWWALCLSPVRQVLGRGLGCLSGLQLGDADLDAELVAFGVCEDHSAELGAPVADDPGAEPDEPGDLLVLSPVGWHDVQVQTVLVVLSSGTLTK
jgi:hypothetical protein